MDLLDTTGGIKINERMEILDKQGNPVAGLYASGVTNGGWQADTSGFGLNSGRIAAENAVK